MSYIPLVSSARIDVPGGERKIGVQTTVEKDTRLRAVLFVEVWDKYRGKYGRKA